MSWESRKTSHYLDGKNQMGPACWGTGGDGDQAEAITGFLPVLWQVYLGNWRESFWQCSLGLTKGLYQHSQEWNPLTGILFMYPEIYTGWSLFFFFCQSTRHVGLVLQPGMEPVLLHWKYGVLTTAREVSERSFNTLPVKAIAWAWVMSKGYFFGPQFPLLDQERIWLGDLQLHCPIW